VPGTLPGDASFTEAVSDVLNLVVNPVPEAIPRDVNCMAEISAVLNPVVK
jgi:hypothetical protein